MKPALALLLGLLAGVAGGVAAAYVRPSRGDAAAPGSDAHALAEVREAIAALERRISAAPGLAAGTAPPPAAAPSAGAPPAAGLPRPAGAPDARPTADLLREVAERAAEAVLERQAAKEKEVAKAAEKKKATLAEIAREMGLSAAQENELRAAYADATEKYLKVFAEPETTPDALRAELEAARTNPAKKTELMVKYMPKMLAKIGDVAAIEMERDARVRKAVGDEKMAAFRRFKVAEEDPFGLDDDDDGGISIGVTTD
jgi:hypothetical protein